MSLSPEDCAAIAARVVELLRAEPLPLPSAASEDVLSPTEVVLTRAEAMAYVKRHSEGAFSDWCRRWGVYAAIRGRYSRQRLEVALDREARETGRGIA